MEKTITYKLDTITLRDCYDCDKGYFVEIYDEQGKFMGEIYGWSADSIDEDNIDVALERNGLNL